MFKHIILPSIILFAISACSLASETEQSTQAETPPPPQNCQSEGYKQFDFWLGEWDVYDNNNELAGTNSITKVEGGCLIVENWTATNGTTGQSYNYYNPATDEWRQVWVSQGAIIDYTGELLESGTMHLEGTLTYQASKKSYKFTGHWVPLDSSEVRQEFELYDPETESWNEWFTGIYKRKAD